MPYNPLTGQYDSYEDTYNTLGSLGAGVMDSLGTESGTATRMMTHLPGIPTLMGFATLRGSNTAMYGGFSGKPNIGASQFMGSSARQQAALAAGKSPMAKGFARNYMPHRLGQFSQMSDIGVFKGYGTGGYSPFRMGEGLNRIKSASRFFTERGIAPKGDEKMFGPGVVSAISAGRKMDKLERRALAGSARAARKLEKVSGTVRAIGAMNSVQPAVGPQISDLLRNRSSLGQGVTGNVLASNLAGAGTQATAGAFRAALGAGSLGLSGNALTGYNRVIDSLGHTLDNIAKSSRGALISRSGTALTGSEGARAILNQGFSKTIGMRGAATLVGQGGLKTAGIMAMRGVGLAIPGVQVIAAASLAYDLGKMGGEIVKNGINLVRDANISMQGSLAKPMFGMGYRDTEAAATSRARGVMAIQNSRLNARSALGGEAAMLAAHYG